MRVRATTRVVACPASHISRVSPNGWRLSGDGGEADGVRCSRGLDAGRFFSMGPLLNEAD